MYSIGLYNTRLSNGCTLSSLLCKIPCVRTHTLVCFMCKLITPLLGFLLLFKPMYILPWQPHLSDRILLRTWWSFQMMSEDFEFFCSSPQDNIQNNCTKYMLLRFLSSSQQQLIFVIPFESIWCSRNKWQVSNFVCYISRAVATGWWWGGGWKDLAQSFSDFLPNGLHFITHPKR